MLIQFDLFSHPYAKITQIQELKADLQAEHFIDEEVAPIDNDSPGEAGGEQGLFSADNPLNLEQILQLLPPRATVERHLSIYFNAGYSVPRKFRASFHQPILTMGSHYPLVLLSTKSKNPFQLLLSIHTCTEIYSGSSSKPSGLIPSIPLHSGYRSCSPSFVLLQRS